VGVEALIERLIPFVGEKLATQGFTGPFGVDCFIFEDTAGRLKIHPMIEINPRHTMGRVALSISKRMAPGRVGIWLHVPKSWLTALGVESFANLKERWSQALPLVTQTNGRGVVLASGLLETTPASLCKHVWTCFVVCHNLSSALETMGISSLMQFSASQMTIDKPELQP
jgi:hypothetical protein